MSLLRRTILMLSISLTVTAVADEAEITAHRLFHIERNKNANIVAYDVQILPDGNLHAKDPVVVYWLKLAEDGARKNLKRIEKKLAYGFKVRERDGNRLVLEMKADVGRDVVVEAVADSFRAVIPINDRPAVLEKIFIFADESGLMPNVEYLELFGADVETGEEAYEKYLP